MSTSSSSFTSVSPVADAYIPLSPAISAIQSCPPSCPDLITAPPSPPPRSQTSASLDSFWKSPVASPSAVIPSRPCSPLSALGSPDKENLAPPPYLQYDWVTRNVSRLDLARRVLRSAADPAAIRMLMMIAAENSYTHLLATLETFFEVSMFYFTYVDKEDSLAEWANAMRFHLAGQMVDLGVEQFLPRLDFLTAFQNGCTTTWIPAKCHIKTVRPRGPPWISTRSRTTAATTKTRTNFRSHLKPSSSRPRSPPVPSTSQRRPQTPYRPTSAPVAPTIKKPRYLTRDDFDEQLYDGNFYYDEWK
jgi:hypothetical protein